MRRVPWGIAALIMLPLASVVGAFAVAPSASLDAVEVQRITETVAISPVALALPDRQDTFWREERIVRGDSAPSLLSRLGVDDVQAVKFLSASGQFRAAVRSNAGKLASARVTEGGELEELHLRGESILLIVRRSGGTFTLSDQEVKLEARVEMRSGQISSSLFSAMDDAEIPDAVASEFAEIFSGDIDLHRELRRGDRFSIIYEVLYSAGEPVRPGRILAAEFVSQGKVRQAVYFEDPSTGRGDYFSPSGRSMKRAFLRSPLEFSRITSGFSSARLHPVLQIWRAHKGIDYSAPVGSRVRVTGEGVVSFTGFQNGYGRVVVVKHAGGYTTLYGHLSGVAKDLQVGKRVQQGEVVGFVGMSGLATGPHLHYEFHVRGVHVDPTRAAPEQGPVITANLRSLFADAVSSRLRPIHMLRDLNVASVE